MKPHQKIFNKNNGSVTMTILEYNKLLLYKECALQINAVLTGGDSE